MAGGNGTRLFPLTKTISKQLLPVYDKPMVYYPLSTLLRAGIRDILIISTKKDLPRFKNLFGDGSFIGINISYKIQLKPNGIAEAFLIAEDFIGNDNICLILGDNIFHGNNFQNYLNKAINNLNHDFSTIYSVQVKNPEQFGVIEFDKNGKVSSIVEKPIKTNSNRIVSGLYFYTNNVINMSKMLKPSKRGELEITEINNQFLKVGKIKVVNLKSTFFWSDTGTYDSLIKASQYFKDFELIYNKKVACIEEIALEKSLISKDEYLKIALSMNESNYGKYLLNILN